jgi:hypothetical protein
MPQTRKSTPKYQIQTLNRGVVIYGPASKTECAMIARGMNMRGKPKVVCIKPA